MNVRIAVVLTCHNRKDKTIECLNHIRNQSLPEGVTFQTVLVDDGSTDGTSEAVSKKFPEIQIIRGDGNLYWCGGMRVAWNAASKLQPDYYLLANDDTLLDSHAIQTLLEIAGSPEARTIAVAAIRDPQSGLRSYGGIKGDGDPIDITGTLESCDTFNANAAIIPKAVHAELGEFHTAYTHALGDYDYGYEATRKGILILQSQHALGTCARNDNAGSWRDRSLPRRRRLQLLQSPKGLPFKEWMTYNRRNSGWKWPILSVSPFFRILLGK